MKTNWVSSLIQCKIVYVTLKTWVSSVYVVFMEMLNENCKNIVRYLMVGNLLNTGMVKHLLHLSISINVCSNIMYDLQM